MTRFPPPYERNSFRTGSNGKAISMTMLRSWMKEKPRCVHIHRRSAPKHPHLYRTSNFISKTSTASSSGRGVSALVQRTKGIPGPAKLGSLPTSDGVDQIRGPQLMSSKSTSWWTRRPKSRFERHSRSRPHRWTRVLNRPEAAPRHRLHLPAALTSRRSTRDFS